MPGILFFLARLFIALTGAGGVALGALGAHLWRPSLEAHGRVEVWETAVLYHLIHAVAAWAAVAGREVAPAIFRAAAWCWLLGIWGFSGSLYLLALGGPAWLGPITPCGGLLLMAGWICAALRFASPSKDD